MKCLVSCLALCVALTACATAGKLKEVRIGMTKAEVVSVMGEPASVSAKGNTVYLNYALSETSDQAFYGVTEPYYVRLVDGRVDAFGRMGDFDSTKVPTVRLESDQTIRSSGTCDLYTELSKLQKLKESGALNEREFESEKAELLENC